jgi:Kef-type K+ transport system membrane component KefB
MTEEKDFTKEALKNMGATATVALIVFAISALIIGTPVAVAAVLGLDCQEAFCVGYLLFIFIVVMLLWFMAEYGAVERKHCDQGAYWEEI